MIGRRDSLYDDGSALSFALRLRNKNSGTSQTHTPKNVTISKKLSILPSPPVTAGLHSVEPNFLIDWRAAAVRDEK